MAKKKTGRKNKPKSINAEEKISVKRSKNDDRILTNILIAAGVIIIAGFLGAYLTGRNQQPTSFEYKGVNFTEVIFCDAKPCLTTYNTKLPVLLDGERAEYNFYFRNDARKLESQVPFEGEINLKNEMNMEITYGLACEGYSSVAMDTFGRVFDVLKVKVNAGEDMTCKPASEKMYVTIQEGDETVVEQTGDSCYTINIKGCEILKGTERFLVEVLAEVNKDI
ncbi:MAG: hypothetical protein KJ905_03650 [Nanoarchaeota archaeon]|nr:hypothetical protein [Nanoarchaeota archaeon]MBU1501835.1 hypothetical protein [Nanoarchaeota archaeon]MBU2459364.1 hypothetical protein [Nanoarchaeota archaeon]